VVVRRSWLRRTALGQQDTDQFGTQIVGIEVRAQLHGELQLKTTGGQGRETTAFTLGSDRDKSLPERRDSTTGMAWG